MFQLLRRWLINAIYLAFFMVAIPWLGWRFLKGKSRRGWGPKLLGWVPRRTGEAPCLWLHAVSVGEVNLLAPVIERLIRNEPELRFAISTSTETGFELATKKYASHQVFFCPYDFSWALNNVIRRIRPRAIVLAELELWPNMISIAQAQQIPVVVFNGRLSENSFVGYRRYGWLTRPIFGGLRLVLAQTETYAKRFRKLGCRATDVIVSGNVKFDGAAADSTNPETARLVRLAGFEDRDFVFVAGSTQPDEDLIAAEVFRKLSAQHPQLKMVLVPRHPERATELKTRLGDLQIDSVLRTQLDQLRLVGNSETRPAVLIVDVIGELGSWWGRADVGYVGGSMGNREGQNMIEPAAFGVPVSFGPRTKNFRDVVDQLLRQDAARVVCDAAELAAFVSHSLAKPEDASAMGHRARAVVEANRGAAEITAQKIRDCCRLD